MVTVLRTKPGFAMPVFLLVFLLMGITNHIMSYSVNIYFPYYFHLHNEYDSVSFRPMSERKDKRTTVSLADVVWKMAEEQMAAKGFNDNFSSYIADLIRRDKERADEQKNPGCRTSYPSHKPPEQAFAEDNPAKPPKKRKAA